MSLSTVAARAALIKQAGLGRAALAAGGLGLVGAAGVGAAHEIAKPTEIPADALGEGAVRVPAGAQPTQDSPIGQGLLARGWTHPAGGWQSPAPSMRERLRARLASLAAGGTGKVLSSWYGAATGKGQPQ